MTAIAFANQGAAILALEERCRALEARQTDSQATTGLLRIEWAEVLDKINRWATRQSGRLSRAAQKSLDGTSEDAPGPMITGDPQSQDPLVARAHAKAALRHRAGLLRSHTGG